MKEARLILNCVLIVLAIFSFRIDHTDTVVYFGETNPTFGWNKHTILVWKLSLRVDKFWGNVTI